MGIRANQFLKLHEYKLDAQASAFLRVLWCTRLRVELVLKTLCVLTSRINPVKSTFDLPKSFDRLLNFKDTFDLNGHSQWQRRNADGTTSSDSHVLAEYISHQFAAAIDDCWLLGEAGVAVNHAEQLHDLDDVID